MAGLHPVLHRQQGGVHAAFLQGLRQHGAVPADLAGVAHRGAGPGQGNALVQALAAAADAQTLAALRFARPLRPLL